jgi:hypothetical protein
VSQEQLQGHIERKHKVEKDDTKSHPKGTPLPVKAKAPNEKINEEQMKVLSGIVEQKKSPVDSKRRPATSYIPKSKPNTKGGFKYLRNVRPEDIPEDMPGLNPPKRKARPQTAKPKTTNLLERNIFIDSKLKALVDVGLSLDEDIINFKSKNFAKSNTENIKGIDATEALVLKKSN